MGELKPLIRPQHHIMSEQSLHAAQQNATSRGGLVFNVTSSLALVPIENATINIYSAANPEVQIERVTSNSVGQTERVELPTPPVEYSEQPQEIQPYANYNFEITSEGYDPVYIAGAELFAGETAV